jgi:hypothetical protein
MGVDHGDVMGAIGAAYPVIMGYHGLLPDDIEDDHLRYLAPENED